MKCKIFFRELAPLSQEAFVEYVRKGIFDAWHNIFLMTGRLDSEVKPEYITTSAISFSLAQDIGFISGNTSFSIKAEHGVFELCKRSLVFLGNKDIDIHCLGLRKGRFDIALMQDVNGMSIPCAIIENKSYVRCKEITKKGICFYKSDWRDVVKDLLRNTAIVNSRVGDVVKNTASTFYVSNSKLVLKEEAEVFTKDLEMAVRENVEREFGKALSDLNVSIKAFEVEANLYNTKEEAMSIDDESECPRYLLDGNWFLAGVIIAISRR